MDKQKILIVDDEPASLEGIVKCYIESCEPFELFQALDGEMAFQVVQKYFPTWCLLIGKCL